MAEPWKQSWEAEAVYRARVRGCLLGGAVGDALGHPVEFSSLDRIRATHGPRGVTGLLPSTDGSGSTDDSAGPVAQITHGHPTGYYAAGAFAAIIAYLLAGDSIEGAALRTLRLLARHPGHEETTTALEQALDLAAEGSPTPEKLEKLGGGWIAEEALAIGLYSALAVPRVEDALLLSVNHSGDSDSTGSICGNILGARHGDHGLPHAWVEQVEGRARIAALADDLAAECVAG